MSSLPLRGQPGNAGQFRSKPSVPGDASLDPVADAADADRRLSEFLSGHPDTGDARWSDDLWDIDWPDRVAVGTDSPGGMADPGELLGYFLNGQGAMGDDGFDRYSGEPVGPVTVGVDGVERARCWMFSLDLTKSARDDVGDVTGALRDFVAEGSPVRSTDRAGAGTKGTRKHEGLGSSFALSWGAYR
jgi:hypothetical protein